jgi:hypothetical protein
VRGRDEAVARVCLSQSTRLRLMEEEEEEYE